MFLLEIPLEIIEKIFCHCSSEDLKNLACTSSVLKENQILYSILWKEVRIPLAHVERFDFSKYVNNLSHLKYTEILRLVNQSGRKRCLSHCENFDNIWKHCNDSRLKEVCIEEAILNDCSARCFQSLTNLKRFTTRNCKLSSDSVGLSLCNMRSLVEIQLYYCLNLNDHSVTSVLSILNQLEVLDLSLSNITDSSLASLQNLIVLKELVLNSCSSITNIGLEHIGNLFCLRKLYLRNCQNISDEGVKHLKQLDCLKDVNVGSIALTDASLYLFSAILPLEKMSFDQCKNISDHGISKLCNLVNLKHLSIGSTAASDCFLKNANLLINLGFLDMSKTTLSNNELGYLETLPVLKELNISQTRITCLENIRNVLSLCKLNVRRTRVSDFRCITVLKLLNTLECGSTKVTDMGISELHKLPNLKELDLFSCRQLSDQCLLQISKSVSLEYLHIGFEVSIVSLQNLAKLSCLKTLKWWSCKNQDPFKAICKMTSLVNLDLTYCKFIVKKCSWYNLKKLVHLKTLELHGTNVTDDCLKYISTIPNLEVLFLSNTIITDRGINYLRMMKRLKTLIVRGSKVVCPYKAFDRLVDIIK